MLSKPTNEDMSILNMFGSYKYYRILMCIPGIGGIIAFSVVYNKRNRIKDFSLKTYYINCIYFILLFIASFTVIVFLMKLLNTSIDYTIFILVLYIITGTQMNYLFYCYFRKHISLNMNQ